MPDFNLGNAGGGLGRLAAALGGGNYQKAYDNELGLQSKLAQALASIEAHHATADLNTVKADGERSQQALQTPEALQRNAMVGAGIPLDEQPAVDGYINTGQLGGKYRPAADGNGPVAPAPDWQDKLGAVARSIAGTQRALTVGDKNTENIAKAGAIDREGRLSDAIISGTANRNTVAGAQAAAGGKPLFHTDTTGSVLDQFTGNLDTNNPMAGSTIGLRGAQAGQAKAGAAAHYAAAENSRAQAEKARTSGAVNADAMLNDDDAKFMAQQYLRGDQSVMTNLGRGAQGAQNIVKLRRAIRDEATAAGMNPAQVATAMAQFQGDKAAFRTAGTKGANMEMAATEADQVADIALQASQAVPRTSYVPVNKALRAYQTNSGDPRIVQFGAATNALINTYARAISPSGTPTVHDKQHAEDILSTAQSPEQYAAVVSMMKKEIATARASPGMVRDSMAGRMGGTAAQPHGQQPAAGGFTYLGKE